MTSTAYSKNKSKNFLSIFLWELRSSLSPIIIYLLLCFGFVAVVFALDNLLYDQIVQNIKDNMWEYLEKDAYIYDTMFGPITIRNIYSKFQVFQFISTYVIAFFNVIFSIIFSIKGFAYLHDKRKADFYGSLPMGRNTILVARICAVICLSLVPALFFYGVIALITAISGSAMANILSVIVSTIIGTITLAISYCIIALCCGTTQNAIVMFLSINVIYPFVMIFVSGIINGFYPFMNTEIITNSFIKVAFSPLSAYSSKYTIYWIIFNILGFALCLNLSKKRKAESAQTQYAFSLPCQVVKTLFSLFSGLVIGCWFGYINLTGNAILGFIVGYLIASVAFYAIAHIVLYKKTKGMFKKAISLYVSFVCVLAGILFCNSDVIKYDNVNFTADDVASAGVVDIKNYFSETCLNYTAIMDDNDFYENAKDCCNDFTDKEFIEKTLKVNKDISELSNTSADFKFAGAFINIIEKVLPDAVNYISNFTYNLNDEFVFSYKLNNGNIVTNYYPANYFNKLSYMEEFLGKTASDDFSYVYENSDGTLSLSSYSVEKAKELTDILTSVNYINKYRSNPLTNDNYSMINNIVLTGKDELGGYTGYQLTKNLDNDTNKENQSEHDLIEFEQFDTFSKDLLNALSKDFSNIDPLKSNLMPLNVLGEMCFAYRDLFADYEEGMVNSKIYQNYIYSEDGGGFDISKVFRYLKYYNEKFANDGIAEISFDLLNKNYVDGGRTPYDIVITKDFTNTIAVLQKYNLLNAEYQMDPTSKYTFCGENLDVFDKHGCKMLGELDENGKFIYYDEIEENEFEEYVVTSDNVY